MGAEQSLHGRPTVGDAILARALLEALSDLPSEESGALQLMREHAWDPDDCSPPFKVLRDGLTARRLPSILTSDCIRGKKGYRSGRHVWEIQWENDERGSFAMVGVATPKAPLQTLGYQPVVGSNTESWGWDIVSKKLWHGGERGPYPAALAMLGFQVPDSFYVILDMDQRTLSFATNEIHLGVAFKQLPKQQDRPMCPIVNAIFGNCDIKIKYMGNGESVISRLKHPFTPLQRSASEYPSSGVSEAASRRRSTGSPGPNLQNVVVTASPHYKFAYTRGDNAAVMCAGKKAKRLNALNTFCNAVVMTAEPLKDNELFEIRLDSKINRWVGGLMIGATVRDSNCFAFPESLGKCKDVYVWSGNKIVYNMQLEQQVNQNLVEITIGDRVGIMRQPDDTLHFYKNGKNIGKRFGRVPKTLYGVVDIFGQAEVVTITGGTAETQSSNDSQNEATHDVVLIMARMKSFIDLLKGPILVDLPTVIKKLAQDIYQPYIDLVDQSVRQRLGDHLAEIGAAEVFRKLLGRLDDRGIETQEGWLGINVVRGILWNYSDASLKIAKKIGECGLLKKFVDDMRQQAGSINVKTEKRKYIVDSAVNILHNCAKATENRQVFRDIKAVETLVPFLQSEDSEMVISTLLTLSYITGENQKDLLKADTKTISILRGMLCSATNSERLRGGMESSSWSALEIVTGIANIAVNPTNCKNLIEADVIPLLFDVMKKGGAIEKESTGNALWVLASLPYGKIKIREHPGAVDTLKQLSKNPNKNIAAAMERVLLRTQQQPMQQVSMGSVRRNCEYAQNCGLFLATLGISEPFFDKRHDKCYCTPCHASRNEKLYYTQGEPAKDYVLPIGWCRFALRIQPAALSLNANKTWHVAYHGTSPSSAKPILECGSLLMPGDTALGGKMLSEVDGHFSDDRKPEGFNTKQIFVSPSIRYSGREVYSKTQSFDHPQTKKTYKAKVAFQLWIKPDSYKVGPQTVGAEEEIDPKFSNQEIEWSTVERGAIHLYGLLVRLDE